MRHFIEFTDQNGNSLIGKGIIEKDSIFKLSVTRDHNGLYDTTFIPWEGIELGNVTYIEGAYRSDGRDSLKYDWWVEKTKHSIFFQDQQTLYDYKLLFLINGQEYEFYFTRYHRSKDDKIIVQLIHNGDEVPIYAENEAYKPYSIVNYKAVLPGY
ncbi:hypothetical protein GCM10023331_23220 [Algivirga pacifica]|uniref:YopX protein domain-containing protein n=1 Tax=Algivirga pacifica TaxID=1162670 RepID=A0ABP9DAG6_9BACT